MSQLIQNLLVLLLGFTVGCREYVSEQHAQSALAVIANPLTTTNQLTNALAVLRISKRTNETPTFWAAIANDPKYRWDTRQRAVLQLVARNFRPGMTFADVGRLLNHPAWLDCRCINISAVNSAPHATESDGIAIIGVGPCQNESVDLIFITRHGHAGIDDNLCGCLKGETPTSNLRELHIDEVLSSEYIHHIQVYNYWGVPPENPSVWGQEPTP